jgi:fumarylacetoacetase
VRGRELRLDLGRPAVDLTECHPYGVYAGGRGDRPRIGARVGDHLLDLAEASARHESGFADVLDEPRLDGVLAAGRSAWQALGEQVRAWVAEEPDLIPLDRVRMLLPFTVADYVDFYASEQHATNVGRILRPGQEPLKPNWRHQPIGYHGRAGTVVVSGTPVVRPHGNVAAGDGVEFRATARLDVEVEVGFVVGTPSTPGVPVSIDDFAEHVFGVVLLNDWSARDIQAWETVPLGPFLGKSFQTSISPWVVPISALDAARVPTASTGSALSPYLVEREPWGLDIDLELRVNGDVVSRPPYRTMHWSPAQMLAHLTVNGASLRTGDLYASGTVSGPADDQVGSLLERWRDERFLDDGDEVAITATAPAADGSRIDLGEVRGAVVASRS